MKMVAAKFLQAKGLRANSCIDWGYGLFSPLVVKCESPTPFWAWGFLSSSFILRD
jgi:hypothetical protein